MSTNSILPRQVHGRPALERALPALEIRAVRLAMHGAATPVDRAWAAHVADDLAALAVSARDDVRTGTQRGGPWGVGV